MFYNFRKKTVKTLKGILAFEKYRFWNHCVSSRHFLTDKPAKLSNIDMLNFKNLIFLALNISVAISGKLKIAIK